ncbi:MAG: protease inhibitor I42 family protein [Terracidiphilus sp.]
MLSERLVCRVDSFRCLLMLVAVACISQAAMAATKVVTDADKGGEVRMKFADRLELRLKSNPTTGYMWYVEKESTPLLKLVHQSQTEVPVPVEERPGLVGLPVFQVFTFEPRHAGDGELKLHYVRSWEKPAPEDERFEIRVVIE